MESPTCVALRFGDGAAVAATVGTWLLGRRLDQAGEVPVEGATEPTQDTPPQAAGAQRGLRVLQVAGATLALAGTAQSVVEGT